jgi:hypothetical protein
MNKTEHAGPKKGRGGYYGPKRVAKRRSDKRRRREDVVVVRDATVATACDPPTRGRS